MAIEQRNEIGVVDPVTVQVIRNSFVAAADEMKTTMVRTAYNDLLYEVQDFGVVVTDVDGNLIGQSDTLPVFLSVLPGCIQTGLQRFGKDGFEDGDVVLANDPYTTGTHISDTAIYMPAFFDGQLVGFAGCMAHWADIGGKSPGGWCPDSTDVFQEGLRFDHIKIVKRGQPNEELLSMIWSNVRLPFVSTGDFGAQLAACKTGRKRIHEIHEKYGVSTVREALAQAFDQSEVLMRAAIDEIPDGEYSAHTFLDHDGVDRSKELRIQVTVRVAGGAVEVDLAGSSPTARGPVNCPLPAVVAGVETALKGLTLPFDRTNAGHLRAISVTAPEGTVVHPLFPAPVDSYGYVYQMVAELVLRALADVLPDKCPAGGYPLFLLYFFRMQRERSTEARSVSESSFVFVDPPVGGAGAAAKADGGNALICLLDGDAPSPVAEMIEARYPLCLERYALNPASAGAGKYRGGCGTIKEYRLLEDDLFCQVSIEGTHYPGWGLAGGETALASAVVIHHGTEREEVIQDKLGFVGPFKSGDVVVAAAGGGGGWGNPLERDPSAVCEDILDEFCTVEEARETYGVVVDPQTLELDAKATDDERVRRRQS